MNYPSSPRRFQRSRNDRMIGGVCGGLAEYLNMDATLVRVLVVIIALVTAAFPVIAIYLLLMLLLPEAQPKPGPPLGYQAPQQPSWSRPADPHRPAEDPVWGPQGAPWSQQDASTPPPSPRQTAEELFARAKNITKPNNSGNPDNSSAPDDSAQTESKPSSDS